MTPSEKERADHDLTHAEFRAWSDACVKARAKDPAHRRLALEDVGTVALGECDYFHMNAA